MTHTNTEGLSDERLAEMLESARRLELSEWVSAWTELTAFRADRRAANSAGGLVVARLHRREGLGPVIERLDASWEIGTGLFDLHAVKVANEDGAAVSLAEEAAPVVWKGERALADVRRLIAEAGEKVEPIVGGPEGETIMAYKMPTGLWLMLQARMRSLLDHMPPAVTRPASSVDAEVTEALTRMRQYGEAKNDGQRDGTLFRFADGRWFFLAADLALAALNGKE